jgi:hypothetical protein
MLQMQTGEYRITVEFQPPEGEPIRAYSLTHEKWTSGFGDTPEDVLTYEARRVIKRLLVRKDR